MSNVHIFSPHIDDAFLSLGGSIFNWRSKGIKVNVYNIFTISNWTPPGSQSERNFGNDVATITALRKAEEREVSKQANFEIVFWDFLDFPLREGFSESDNRKLEDQIFEKLSACLNSEDLFFFPMGILHPDHLLICRLSEKFIGKSYNIFYYEDMPYLSWGKSEFKEVYKNENVNKSPLFEKIDFVQKAEILKYYRSQVLDDWFNYMMAYSYNNVDNEYYERYWRVNN